MTKEEILEVIEKKMKVYSNFNSKVTDKELEVTGIYFSEDAWWANIKVQTVSNIQTAPIATIGLTLKEAAINTLRNDIMVAEKTIKYYEDRIDLMREEINKAKYEIDKIWEMEE